MSEQWLQCLTGCSKNISLKREKKEKKKLFLSLFLIKKHPHQG
jgi:hypothetical protein